MLFVWSHEQWLQTKYMYLFYTSEDDLLVCKTAQKEPWFRWNWAPDAHEQSYHKAPWERLLDAPHADCKAKAHYM